MKIKESFKYGDRFQIEYILSKLLNKDRVFLHLNDEFEFDDKEFLSIIKQLNNGYPIEYIFKEVEFFGEKFYIEEGVLIPRDDTEPLIEESFKEINEFSNIAEIGVGSGVISTILAKTFPSKKFIGTDINPLAIEVSKKNFERYNIKNVKLYKTSLLDGVNENIEVIISNPPYVENSHQKPNEFEPDEAFFADDNGTFLLKEIVKEGLKRGVKLIICEMGYQQKEIMSNFFNEMKLSNFRFYKDLGGRDRGFVIKL